MYSKLKEKIDLALNIRNREKNYLNDIGSNTIPQNKSIRLFGQEKISNRIKDERCKIVVYLYAEDRIRIEYGIENYVHPFNITQKDSINYEVKKEEILHIDGIDTRKIDDIFSYLISEGCTYNPQSNRTP